MSNNIIDLRLFTSDKFPDVGGWEFIGDEAHAVSFYRWNNDYHFWPVVYNYDNLPESVHKFFEDRFQLCPMIMFKKEFILRLSYENLKLLADVLDNDQSENELKQAFKIEVIDLIKTIDAYNDHYEDEPHLEVWYQFHS